MTAAFGSGSLLSDAITGQVTDEQWRHDVAHRLEQSCGPIAHAAVRQWSAWPGDVDQDVVSVLASARLAGWRVGLLTNATTRLTHDLRELGLHGAFDAVTNSSALRVAKPDPGAYLGACAHLGVEPEGCVFVDDTESNVVAAAALGIDAHLHQGAPWLADLLGVSVAASRR